MSLNNQNDPEMSRNFWLSMALSLVILIGYPYFLEKMSPKKEPAETLPAVEQQVATQAQAVQNAVTTPLSQAEGPFIEKPTPPALLYHQNNLYDVVFSTLGGTITRLEYKGREGSQGDRPTVFFNGREHQPGIMGLRLLHDRSDLSSTIFKVNKSNLEKGFVDFIYERPGEYRMTKSYAISQSEPVVLMSVSLSNLSNREKHFPLELAFGLNYEIIDKMEEQYYEAVVSTDKIEAANVGKIAKKGFSVKKEITWSGVIKKYYAMIVHPEIKALSNQSKTEDDVIVSTLRLEPVSLAAGQTISKDFLLYAGPQEYEELKSIGSGLENVLSRGFFGPFKVWLLIALKYFNTYTHNYGWAIVILTFVLKVLFAPIMNISFQSQRKMQAIQPKLKVIQEKYKKNPEKLQKETMEIFKKNKVNPMAGCLPMLIQMPVLLAMFRLLPEAIELRGAPFIFWISDLSQPDQLFKFPFAVPLLGWDALNILPILMIFSQYGFQKIMPAASTSPEQAKIFAFMPILFGFICYNMPSGLVLYWFIQNLLSIVHHMVWHRKPEPAASTA